MLLEQLHGVVANGLISLSVALPQKWSLRLVSKNIEIKPGVPLSEYPLSNGDQLILDAG